jgi:hypothetical protein
MHSENVTSCFYHVITFLHCNYSILILKYFLISAREVVNDDGSMRVETRMTH